MALPAPNLDDRRFQDLVDDAKRMVQRNCPTWTDHNVSDPGVTLIETFAFMTDQLLYRLNRLPDRLHVAFLDLIGLRLLPPTPARADVTFWLSTPALAPTVIASGTQVGTVRTEAARSILFSTREDLRAVPCALRSVRTGRAGADETVARIDELALRTAFGAFAERPAVGDHLLVGLDGAVPGCAVRLDLDGTVHGIGVNPLRPPLVWEAWTGRSWTECPVTLDETGGLNRAGAVILLLPPEHEASVVDGDLAGWLRARVVSPEDGQPPYSASPVVHGLTACTVGVTGAAVNAEIVDNETLGNSEGVPGQVFSLLSRPALAGVGEPVVEVSSVDGWQEWSQVEHFAASSATDRHFALDAYAGEVRFGPAVRQQEGTLRYHGAVPAKGAAIRIRQYAVGGGAAGNVAAGAIRTLKSSVPFVAAVQNLRAAQGGVDGETLDEARDRGSVLLRTRSRAVTAEDYEVLSRQAVPEAARIRCVTAGDAGTEAGSVRVLVVPSASVEGGRIEFADLIPAEATLARLADRLDEVRLIGTRVMVEPPRYRGVTVVARVRAVPRTKVVRVRDDGLLALYEFLSPLPGGGPNGHGWPFGRAVRTGDLYGVLQRVRGVETVEDVRLFTANPLTGERGQETSVIEVEPNSLVFSFDHQLRVDGEERGR